MTKPSKSEIKKYNKLIKDGVWKYLLTQGGKMGIIFAGLMFLMDYVIWKEVQGTGTYLFYGISFGFFAGLWGWHNINKIVKK